MKSNTTLVRQPEARPDKRRVFELRCWAKAYLFGIGEILLIDAVYQLQADAENSGLVDEIGQDEVQRILGAAFGMARPS